MAFGAILKLDKRFTAEQIAAALLCPLPCNQHVNKLPEGKRRRAVERIIVRAYEFTGLASTLQWRERRSDGRPAASMHNARLGVGALGIECRFDTFHNKILFGYRGDMQHEVQAIVGEVSDNGIIRLRQILSDRFGFDFEDKHTRDAVTSLALEHCFDPVRDMLDEAQGTWDGLERLDRMAVEYFNCADTPFNRAALCKAMIAAVRRVRHPGCKFDNIVVLESEEGWNKSSAWRVLAGDENFSDESVLGKGGREVQEQLSEVWIHENADLAGMRKAEVEQVKAFASRQEYIARPAYGRFLKRQPRHSIEVGTTNSDEYLQSQIGNRRFWPLLVRKPIDLERLRRDRLQLWGEAARYEAQGESITLDERLWPAAKAEQEMRRVKDPWEEVLADIPDQITKGGFDDQGSEKAIQIIHWDDGFTRELVASGDLLTHVLHIPIDRQETKHTMRLANVMKHLGWERDPNGNKITINGRQVRGYWRWPARLLP